MNYGVIYLLFMKQWMRGLWLVMGTFEKGKKNTRSDNRLLNSFIHAAK